jgi:hypothetical protein
VIYRKLPSSFTTTPSGAEIEEPPSPSNIISSKLHLFNSSLPYPFLSFYLSFPYQNSLDQRVVWSSQH